MEITPCENLISPRESLWSYLPAPRASSDGPDRCTEIVPAILARGLLLITHQQYSLLHHWPDVSSDRLPRVIMCD